MVFGIRDIYDRHYIPYKKGEMPYNDFSTIVKEMNKLVMCDVIEKGHRLRLKNNLGPIYVECMERKPYINNSSINWKASLALRDRLIEQGITPYHKDRAPHGKKWFVLYDTDHVVRFRWRKETTSVKNYSMYSFVPSRGKVGVKTQLKDFILEDPDRVHIYTKRPK